VRIEEKKEREERKSQILKFNSKVSKTSIQHQIENNGKIPPRNFTQIPKNRVKSEI
jgi:hypothetical protein